MDFLPSIEHMIEVAVARVRGSDHLQGLDVRKGGFIWSLANAFSREGRALCVRLADAVLRDSYPGTARGDALRRWAAALLSGGPLPGITAMGTAWIYATDPAAIQASGSSLVAQSGQQYLTTMDAAPPTWVAIGARWRQVVTIEAVEVGTASNLALPASFLLQTPGADIEPVMELIAWTRLGTEAEGEEQLQRRVAQRLSDSPGAGSPADYRAWALEAGAYDAFVYPLWGAPAADPVSVAVRLIGPPGDRFYEEDPDGGTARQLAITNAARTLIETRQPPWATLESCDWVSKTPGTRVYATVYPEAGYEPSFRLTDFAGVVTGWTAATRTVTTDVDPVDILAAGSKVVLLHEPMYQSEEYTVESVANGGGGGPFTIVIDRLPPTGQNIEIGPEIMPGGPLYQPVRDAIFGVVHATGPSEIIDPAYPNVRRWPWTTRESPSSLWSSLIVAGIEGVPGTDHTDLVFPVFPGLPNDLVVVGGTPLVWFLQGGPDGMGGWYWDIRLEWE